jgi:hypothetical protein
VRRHKVARLDAETHPVHRVTDENDLLQAEGSDDLLKVFDEVIDCEVTSRPLALPMPVKIKQVDIACAEQSRRRECRDPECGSPGEASTMVLMVMETITQQAVLAHPPRPCMATIGGGAEVAHSLEFDPLLDLLESR